MDPPVVEILRPVPIAVVRPRAHIDKRGRTALRAHALLEHRSRRAWPSSLSSSSDESELDRDA